MNGFDYVNDVPERIKIVATRNIGEDFATVMNDFASLLQEPGSTQIGAYLQSRRTDDESCLQSYALYMSADLQDNSAAVRVQQMLAREVDRLMVSNPAH